MSEYNLTQLDPERTFERHIFHRDQFAHYLRWSHVIKVLARAYKNSSVVDLGCGSGNLCLTLYANRMKPLKYLGVDFKKSIFVRNKNRYAKIPWASFLQSDIVNEESSHGKFDIVCCFEVIEHIQKKNVDKFFENLKSYCHKDSIILLSTPVYDQRVGAAKNHIIDGQICEFGYIELNNILLKYFNISSVYGTFASQKDIEKVIPEGLQKYYDMMKEFHSVDVLSVMFACMFPEKSRNCLWTMRLNDADK